MGHLDDDKGVIDVSDLIQDPVLALSHSVEFTAAQFLAIRSPRFVRQGGHPLQDPRDIPLRDCTKVPGNALLDLEAISCHAP